MSNTHLETENMSKQTNRKKGKKDNAEQSFGWAIDTDIMSKYKRRFNFLDEERRRFLTGTQTYYSFTEWGLQRKHLAKIWKLADIDEDRRLVSQEFILAMQLCKQMKERGNIPDSLPKNLIPPLFRGGSKNNIIFHCDEQVDMGIDHEYNVYLQSQDQTTFVTHKLCIICFKPIERSNFSRHWKAICKQEPIVAITHQPCPYCPPEQQCKLYRSDNLNHHLLKDHQIGKMERKTWKNTSLKNRKSSRNVSSTLRISSDANMSWSSTIITTNEESLNPSALSDIPEFAQEVEVEGSREDDAKNQSQLNEKVNSLEKEKDALRSEMETLIQQNQTEKEKLNLEIAGLKEEKEKMRKETLKEKLLIEQKNQRHQTEKDKLNLEIAGLKEEKEKMRNETLKEKLLIEQKNLQSIKQLRSKLVDKIKLITKNGQEIIAELIKILLSDDSAAVMSKLRKLLEIDNDFINNDVKFWCHKELADMYALHEAEISEKENSFEQFRHIVAALQIKFDESMMSDFNKIKSQYGNDPLDRFRPSINYIKYCYAALNLEETATRDEVEDAVINLQVRNHPDDEKGRIKRPKNDFENKRCDDLFTDLELSHMQTVLLAKINS